MVSPVAMFQCLKMRSGDMNDIQRRQRLLPDGNKFGSQAVTPCGGRVVT
ncbi:Uncharacterised protein [Escherichia coli]|uniref:Uncharacterized protein n=1 Tax=Escherichia coli TaxID=562 RepID=A0A2X1NF64_ECOLX|nr:Uncharacterised protein [Escherichia coli]